MDLTARHSTHTMCEMNITLSIDEKVAKKVRQIAYKNGTSLNAMVRVYLQRIAVRDNKKSEGTSLSQELFEKMDKSIRRTSKKRLPRKFTRQDVYRGRI